MPQNAGQFYEEALKSFNKNEMPLSLEYSKACLAADNNYALCYRLLGIIYSRLGQAEKSVAAYRNYVEKAPNSDEAAEVRKLIRRYDEIKKNNETR
jgi:tetratricopeptide (TPR) repeat protein